MADTEQLAHGAEQGAAHGAEHAHSPFSQFDIHTLIPLHIGGVNVSFTNVALFMFIVVGVLFVFFQMALRHNSLIPGRMQSMAEGLYDFIAQMLRDSVGPEGRKFFPLIFSVFVFVMFANLIGMIPGAFTVTSHIMVTFVLAGFLFILITVVGFVRHGTHYFSLFLPEGTPMWMAPLMVVIELFSYLARPVSLSIRLAANMIAGHTMLKIIAGFIVPLGILAGWLPLAFLVVLTGFEIFVALLQAYIFAMLTSVYLNDAINLH